MRYKTKHIFFFTVFYIYWSVVYLLRVGFRSISAGRGPCEPIIQNIHESKPNEEEKNVKNKFTAIYHKLRRILKKLVVY